MPVCRSLHWRISFGDNWACWVTRSMTMKSLPRPCILVNRSSMSGLGQQRLAGEQLADRLPATNQMCCRAVHHHLGRTGTGVVVRTHDEAVGTGGTHRQQIALSQRQFPVLAEEIAGFADRADQ